ncbi:hypothetical protein FIU28_17465 [Tardiphaga sp. vice154]|uniref:hypothetical protein n=1 Tax=Tardiphaga sp. vice154 TaxID=2592814 RepID=UPI0011658D7A|nr:hypothetical protein [Tardiphaga sp. vice154]QDM22741.1 hypothetical protein FIU28_17465 [Tardiphaga sp. vice154]
MKIRIETEVKTDPAGEDIVWMSSTIAAKLRDALDAVNGAAKTFTLTSPAHVGILARQGERFLIANGVPLSDRAGATVTMTPGGPAAKAYKNAAISTRVTLTRGAKCWFLTGIERVNVWPGNPEKFDVAITDAAAENLVKRALAKFGRKPQFTPEGVAKAIYQSFNAGGAHGLMRAPERPSA